MRALRGRVSGLCQPTYVLDIPGGHGKAPIGPSYVSVADGGYVIEDYNGGSHTYREENRSADPTHRPSAGPPSPFR